MNDVIDRFFQAIVPSSGGVVAARKIDGKIRQTVLSDRDCLGLFANENRDSGLDCWFAPSSYAQGWHEEQTFAGPKMRLRTKDNVQSVKSLWLDVDVGEGKPYETRKDAMKAAVALVRRASLPLPWVVASGAKGVHLYFPFNEEIERDEWEDLASRLAAACKSVGFAVDPTRTVDVASIMRCPGTFNMKGVDEGGDPHLASVLIEGRSAPVAYYKKVLAQFEGGKKNRPVFARGAIPNVEPFGEKVSRLVARLSLEQRFDYSAIRKKYYNLEQFQPKKRPAQEVIDACTQIRNQDGASEPVWRGMLATLRHCEGGIEAAHRLSALDKRYTREETDAKLNELKAAGIKPYTCSTFAFLRPSGCEGCPLKGMINSPIGAPKPKRAVIRITPVETKPEPEAAPKVEPVAVELKPEAAPKVEVKTEPKAEPKPAPMPTAAVNQATIGVKAAGITEIRTDHSIVNETGCYVKQFKEDGSAYWRKIHNYPVYPLQRVRGRSAKGETQISYVLRKHRKNGYDDVQIDGGVLMGTTLNSALGSYGFLLNDKERKLMAGLLIDILKETEDTIGEVKTTDRLGWDDSYNAFLLGNKLYKTDGKVFEIAVTGKARPFSDQTAPQGSVDVWKKIASVYSKKGLEWGQAVMAAAFASPLMPLGALEKAALLFVTGDKGVGKSTALMLAASVYGNPERLMFNKMDTPNSRFHKLGIFSNITAAFDEMTDMSPKEASEFAYTLTQGRGKDRMGSGGEDMLLNTTYWSCLPIMSANDSIINALSQRTGDPTAQMTRVLEARAEDINKFYTKEEVEENEQLVRMLPQNYGCAGDLYIRYVTAHKEEVLAAIRKVEKEFKAAAGLNSNHRFWTHMCTRMLVGTMIARLLGLVDYDLKGLFAYLVKLVKAAKLEVGKYVWSPEDAVPQFLSANLPNRLVVTGSSRPLGMRDDQKLGAENDVGYVVQAPAHGRELTMRVELDSGDVVISLSAIRQWCKKAGVAYAEFMTVLNNEYKIKTERTKRDLGKSTVYRNCSRPDCIVVNMPTSMFDIEQQNPAIQAEKPRQTPQPRQTAPQGL